MRAVGPPHPSRGRALLRSAVLTRRACPLGGAEVELLEGGEKKPSILHRAVLNLIERLVEGHAAAASALLKAGGTARLLALLRAWRRGPRRGARSD